MHARFIYRNRRSKVKYYNMAQTVCLKFPIAFLLLLIMVAQGISQRCAPSSIDIQQANTGKKAGALDTVFEVTVTNRCGCAVKNVYLQANGFSSSTAVDPKLFRRVGAGYLLGDGRQILSSKSVTFQYAWDHYIKMTPASVQAEC